MSVNRLIIVASIEGVGNVVKRIGDIGNAAAATQRQTALLGKSLGGLVAAVGISGVARLSDEFTNLENRLRTVTTSSEQLGAVYKQLFQVAQETRSSFDATAKLFQRVSLASKQLGGTTQQNIRFTELLNKATIISGASTIEAEAALIQLSQGMAKGKLNGDELRSVLEQLPIVADAIAMKMGVTRGALRDLGAEGQITSKIVYDAVLAMSEWDAMFAKLSPTMAQGLNNIRNAFGNLLRDINQVTGVFTAIGNSMLFVADNMNMLATMLGGAAIVATIGYFTQLKDVTLTLSTVLSRQLGPVAMQVVRSMTQMQLGLLIVRTAFLQAATAAATFVRSNPFTAIGAALVVLLPLMYQYGDSINLVNQNQAGMEGKVYTLRMLLDQLGITIQQAVIPIMQGLSQAFQTIWTLLQTMAAPIYAALEGWQLMGQNLVATGGTVFTFTGALYALAEGFSFALQTAVLPFGLAAQSLGQIMFNLGWITAESLKVINDNTQSIGEWAKAGLDAGERIAAFDEKLAKLTEELGKNKVSLDEASAGLSGYGGAADDAANATGNLASKLNTANASIWDSTAAGQALRDELFGVGEGAGAADEAYGGFNSTLNQFTGIDGQVANGLNGIASGLAGVANAANSAANAVRNFNAASSGGGGGGGSGPSSTPLGGFGFKLKSMTVISGKTGKPISGARANGGPVSAGKTYLVGENGPELFTAKEDGDIHPSLANDNWYKNLKRKYDEVQSQIKAFWEGPGKNGAVGPYEVGSIIGLQNRRTDIKEDLDAYVARKMRGIEEKERKALRREFKNGFQDDGMINAPGFEDYNKPAPKIDFQTPTPWQSGSPMPLQGGSGSGSVGGGGMQIVVNIQTADVESFRRNRAQVEEDIRATVERAMRRKNRR
jgi:tape measure domain-containing protein